MNQHATVKMPFARRKRLNTRLLDRTDLAQRLEQQAQNLLAKPTHKTANRETDLRALVLETTKHAYTQAMSQAQAGLNDGRYKGSKCARLISDAMDDLICVLCDFVGRHMMNPSSSSSTTPAKIKSWVPNEGVTVLAVGGYGRAKLAPGSDIDLLFVLPDKKNDQSDIFIEHILYILWDMGLKVGQATRSLTECIAQARADMTIRTAILEARYLWGSPLMAQTLRDRYVGEVMPKSARAFVAAKLAERDTRHARTGESRYLVEPNVKEGKGGLRDLNTLFWMAKYCYNVETIDELVAKGLLTREELNLFKRCDDFLWMVRCHLHFITGRAEERLSFDIQTALAQAMKVKGGAGQNKVERFMRLYFLTAKNVGDLTRIFCSMLEDEQAKPSRLRTLPALFRRQKQVHGFTISGQRIKMVRQDVFDKNPINLIRMFKLANDYKLLIHPDTLRQVTRSLGLIDTKLRENPEANQLFLDILTSRNHPERILRRMNEAGVLGKFLPDFGRIVALMQFNMYHHYTADEHLLRAIGLLASLERGELKDDHPLAHELMIKSINRKVIYLAMLLHDIAKGRKEDHSIAGARIARRLGPRLGLTKAETDLTQWLVQEHLVMSDTAQRRDLSDPQTIIDFTGKVQSLERLRHLLVLTVIDIRAVGPGVWNGWKGQLLRSLYSESEAHLMGSASHTNRPGRVAGAQAAFMQAHAQRAPDWSLAKRKKYMKRHYDAYWLSTDIDMQMHHADLLTGMKTSAAKSSPENPAQNMVIDARSETFQDVTTLTFIAEDNAGLFSRLTGACAVAGLDIVDARIITTRDGMAVDVLRLQEPVAHQSPDEPRIERLTKTVERVMSGALLPATQIVAPNRAKRLDAFKISPNILMDNELSQHSTVIEVSGLDRPALLHALAHSLFHLNVSIVSARVATFGERAVDVFYVQDVTGNKITRAGKLKLIEKKLEVALRDPLSAIGGATAKTKKTNAKKSSPKRSRPKKPKTKTSPEKTPKTKTKRAAG